MGIYYVKIAVQPSASSDLRKAEQYWFTGGTDGGLPQNSVILDKGRERPR
jgi:hypothetical protein